MAILSVLYFFTITFGLGYAITNFAKGSESFLERNLMRIGIGLGAFIALGLILNLFRIPLDYRIFLALSVISIFFCIYRSIASLRAMKTSGKISGIKLTQADLFALAMLLLFFFTFSMHYKGAFSYPYLEDDDSWGHALGVKYVSVEKTAFAANSGIRYIEPYPPGYDMVFGILHQTNNSLYWTLKFFNALVISLSLIFFYFFAKVFSNSSKKALFSAFALFAVPSYLSHFIWAIAITMPLFFTSFYAVEKIKHDKKWLIISAVMIAATLTTSPTHGAYFGLFFAIYIAVRMLVEKKFLLNEFIAGSLGFLLSLIFWWIPMLAAYGIKGTLSGIGVNLKTSILDIAGTADRIYAFNDFFIAQKANMINNPIGIGIFLSLLLGFSFLSILFKYYNEIKKNRLKIFAVFVIMLAVTLFLLSRIYVKNVTKRNLLPIEPGTVPFSEFLHGQAFLIAVLSVALFLLVSLAVIIHKSQDFKDKYLTVILAWFVFSFFAVNAGPFYYKLSPFRAWIILAIPVSLLCGEAINSISSLTKSLYLNFVSSSKLAAISSFAVLGILAYGIIMTSFVQKYEVNTALWPPGGFWTSNEEIQGYIWLKDNIPPEAKVFTFSNDALILGLDKFICHWCSEVRDYKANGFNQTAEENYNWLRRGNYNYIAIDGQAARKFGANQTNIKVQDIINSNKFKTVFSNKGLLVFGVGN